MKSISSYRLFYPITKIPENEKITDAFKLFRRYVRNISVKKTVFRRGCESDTVERVKHIMSQAGSQSDRLAASVETNVPAKPNSLSTL